MDGKLKTPGETQRLVNLLFSMFETIYPSDYKRQFPTDEFVLFQKKSKAHLIRQLSEEQIKKGFDKITMRRMAAEKSLDFLDLDKILGVITGKMPDPHAAPAGIYKEKRIELTVDGRDKAPPSIAESEMSKLRELLGA